MKPHSDLDQTGDSRWDHAVDDGHGQPRKTFNFWGALGLAVCCSGAWEGWTASLAQGILGGGPVGLVYGWIFVSIGISCLACSMAELASMYPMAGGQYVWVAQIAPKKWAPVLSWFNAWITIVGLLLAAVSTAMGMAVQVQSYAVISQGYEPVRWHAFLIVVALISFWMIVNIFFVQFLSPVNISIIYVHVGGFLACIITLLVCTKQKNSAAFVFTTFTNETGWGNGVAWCVGQLSALFAFFSLDSATHFSEEVPRREITVPRVIVLQTLCNAVATLPFIIVVLFCMGNPDDVLQSTIGYMSPFTEIVYRSTGSPVAGIFLNGVSTWTAIVAVGDLLGASARIIWSLGRDGALPPRWGHLSERWGVPIPALLVQFPVAVLITMIYIWNSTAFYGLMGGTLVCFQISYCMPTAIKVLNYKHFKTLPRGPWRMGWYGRIVDAVSMCFGLFMIVFMSFPSIVPVTATNMNYSCVLVGAAVILAATIWFAYARTRFENHLPALESPGLALDNDNDKPLQQTTSTAGETVTARTDIKTGGRAGLVTES